MTEAEYAQQKTNRTSFVDVSSKTTTNGDVPGKKTSTGGKLNNLFEIQNTLDDTCELLEPPSLSSSSASNSGANKANGSSKFNGSGNHVNGSNRHHHHPICIEDTDPEDDGDETNNTSDVNNSNAEFHLEMSHSIINQSTYSCNLLTFLIVC